MTTFTRGTAAGGLILLFGTMAACSSAGSIAEILGGALGGGQQQAGQTGQGEGTVREVDARTQQISLQLPDGKSVALLYDNQTKVVYQNQLYAVSNLEAGDQVIVRVRTTNEGGYYTDSVHVTRSVTTSSSSGGTSGSSANVQSLQGTVRQIDRNNAAFALEAGNGVMVTVSMPANAARADVTRFQNLRVGNTVRISGVFVTNTRVELRQFY